MSNRLIITVIIFAVILGISVLYLLLKNRITVKYALIWLFSTIIIIVVAVIPNLMEKLAKLLGFELLSNMVLCLFIAILMFLTLILTVIIAGQKKKTTLLIQELSLLKSEVKKND